ncbi:hypothetical protein L917_06910, partial [Phytophthora nicotianae]
FPDSGDNLIKFVAGKKQNFAYRVHYHSAAMQFEDGSTVSTTGYRKSQLDMFFQL